MTLLFPLGLAALLAIPALWWLWRFTASKHRVAVPSLVPFEHLLRRTPSRRSRSVRNLLFWLQLAALALLAAALARPALVGERSRIVLAVLDTSASMGAEEKGRAALDRAKERLLDRIGRKGIQERWFIMQTAPVAALTPEPTADIVQLRQAVQRAERADLSGSIAIAVRIGRALAGAPPDRIVVVTDEPAPERLPDGVSFESAAPSLPNAAIVGIDAQEPLCTPSTTQIVVGVQNFADDAQTLDVELTKDGGRAERRTQRLEPGARASLAWPVPEGATGLYRVALRAPHDALSLDNAALVALRGAETIPAVVTSRHPEFLDVAGRWLDACPRVVWKPGASGADDPGGGRELLVTDDAELAASWPGPAFVFAARSERIRAMPVRWLADSSHPVAEYLEPLQRVTVALAPIADAPAGDPVVWGLVAGRRLPLVRVASQSGHRRVYVLFDPTQTESSVPTTVLFLNGLRWLTGNAPLVRTGEPLVVGPFDAGAVRIIGPEGRHEVRQHSGGWLRHDATARAGRYRFARGAHTVESVVNFLDPVESNTRRRASTWQPDELRPSGGAVSTTAHQPIDYWLIAAAGLVLIAEWLVYALRPRRAA